MDPAAYLERIHCPGPRPATLQYLGKLHRAHLLSVPFENLDIHLRRAILLDEESFYRKVVIARRGGFCYELNGLFAALLRSLGYRVALLSAGVAREDGGFGPEFDHLALRVDLDEEWLADVGFGDGFRYPLRLAAQTDQPQDGRLYRLEQRDRYWVLLRDEQPQYRFTTQPRRLDDYEGMCRYHQTSPLTTFTRGRVCSLATPEGRVTLTDAALIETGPGGRVERQLKGEDEFRAALRERFRIVLD